MEEFLPISWNESDEDDIKLLASINSSFRVNVLFKKRILNDSIFGEIDKALHGVIPRNFVINIRGGVGRQTGIFKTSLAAQFCLATDPSFNPSRVAFTTNGLNELVKEQAIRKQIFMLDEVVRDLKQSAEQRLANIIDSCREKQLCFVIVGVPEKFYTFSDYYFERLGESSDDLLPMKTIYYSVYKLIDSRKYYRGFIRWNIKPLSDPDWSSFWSVYMEHKSEHERKVIEQNVTGYDFKKSALSVYVRVGLSAFIKVLKNGRRRVDIPRIKNEVYVSFPDITNEEREMIKTELVGIVESELMKESEDENNKETKKPEESIEGS